MRLRHIDVDAVSEADPATIYRLLADGSTWPSWSPIESFELEAEGDPLPEGVGAIRVFRLGRTTGRDQVLELVPNRRIRYATLSGVPVRDYVGTVDLEVLDDGRTRIHWQSTFAPKVRGTGALVERTIRRFLQGCATGLAEYTSKNRATNAA
jgi:hypothetical protein